MSLLVPEHLWAVMTIMQEAASEPREDKIMVAEVILNRTRAKYMSDGTITGTCLHAMQFSGWNALAWNPKTKRSDAPNVWRITCAKADDTDHVVQECIAAWNEAVSGSRLACGAVVYFREDLATNPPDVRQLVAVAKGRHHIFYATPQASVPI